MSIQGLSSADNMILGSRAPRDPFAVRAEAVEVAAAPEGTLVTLHFPQGMYDGAEKICRYFKERGFSRITFDREHSKIHFGYDLELCVIFFDARESLLAERIFKVFEEVCCHSFEQVENRNIFSKVTSEGARVEMYAEPLEAFVEESALYFKAENLDAWVDDFVSKMAREMDPGEVLTKEQLKEARAEFLNNAPEFLKHFETASSVLSSYSREELEKMAENVTVTETHSDLELEFDNVSEQVGEEFQRECEAIARKSTEELMERVEDRFEALRGDLEKEIAHQHGFEIVSRAPRPKSRGNETKSVEAVVAPPKKVKRVVKDAIIEMRRNGKPEEIFAYNLKEAGLLAREKFETHKKCMQEGAALLRALKKKDFKVEERLVQTTQKAQERSMAASKASTRALFRSLLQTAPGLCFGEDHAEIDAVKLLVDNMSKLPVKFLFLEGFSTALQPLLDAYFETGNMPALLKSAAIGDGSGKKCDPSYSMLALIREAKKCGVRVVGIENPLSRHAPHVRPFMSSILHRNFEVNRFVTMNYPALQIIQKTMSENPGQKFLLLTGAYHQVECGGLPGLAKMLGCPSIAACPSLKEGIESGEFRTNDSFDYFFNPDTTPPLTPEELAAKKLKAVQRKVKAVQTRIAELQRLVAKTDKASRTARPGRYIQLAQLEAKLARLRN